MATHTTNPDELSPYIDSKSWQLLPLHKYNTIDEVNGRQVERGKSPLHKNWVTRIYKTNDQLTHMQSGYNVGVRLAADQLVIDVDPRNFDDGDDPISRLAEDCELDLDKCPTVETGAGGWHIYLIKPADVPIRDSLPDYHGVEFKTRGRQVVAAGSLHPNGRHYTWDFLRPTLADTPKAPTKLLNIIRRPQTSSLSIGGGEHTQEELARMLDNLSPEDFQDHDDWLTLMQACHHATNGDGRQEFIDWSTGDLKYANDAGLIGRRWDSLIVSSGSNQVTYRTLHKILSDAGLGNVIPRTAAVDDFDMVGPEDLPHDALEYESRPDHEKLGPLERMNDTYHVVMDGGAFKIMWEEVDPETGDPEQGLSPRKRWIKANKHAFMDMLSNRRVQRGDKTVPIAEAWLDSPKRRQVRGVVFDPERNHDGFLNLWTGWGVQPSKRGSWDRLNELLFEVLANGDQQVYDYILNWSAYMTQFPGRPAEVAVAIQGSKGAGKGTFFRALAMISGKHGMQVTSSDSLTGRFNSHLRDVIFLFADEAITPYDKDGESRLKAMLTEPTLSFEGKGADIIQGRNRLHVGMATNEDWFIPASLEDERRFMATQANNKWRGQSGKFAALYDELKQGGLNRLLWDLLSRDLNGWHPRDDIPVTEALAQQKIRSLSPVGQWWFQILESKDIGADPTRDEMNWETGPIRIYYRDLQDSYAAYCSRAKIRNVGGMGRSLEMFFADELRKICPHINNKVKEPIHPDRLDLVGGAVDKRTRAYEIPSIAQCREDFENMLGIKLTW